MENKKEEWTKCEKLIYDLIEKVERNRPNTWGGGNRYKHKTIDEFYDEPLYEMQFDKSGLQYHVSTIKMFQQHFSLDDICLKFNKKGFGNNCTFPTYYSWGRECDNPEYYKMNNFFTKHFGGDNELDEDDRCEKITIDGKKYKITNPYCDIEKEQNTLGIGDCLWDSTFQYILIRIKDNKGYEDGGYVAIAYHAGESYYYGYCNYRLFKVDDVDSFLCDLFTEPYEITEYSEYETFSYLDNDWNKYHITEPQYEFIIERVRLLMKNGLFNGWNMEDKHIRQIREHIENWDNLENVEPLEIYNPNQIKIWK